MKFKKIISIPTLAAMAMALGLSAAWADAPNLLTYQGRILESGVLVNGTRNVTISICNAIVSGTCDSTGTQSVSVNNGLFRTTFTAPTSGPNTLFGTGNRYLEVNVGGTVLSPREQLTSSPFAAVAGFVSPGSIGTGALGSGVTIGAGQVGTGILGTGVTVNPGAIGTGALGSSVVVSPGQIGTGVVVSTVSFNNSVGIGTSNPLQKFHVSGGGIRISTGTGEGQPALVVDPANGRVLIGGDGPNSTSASPTLMVTPNDISSNGSVGIGTTNPQSRLQVSGNYVQIPTTSGSNPAPGDCDVAAEAGRLIVRSDGGAGSRLWVCLGAGGWVGF